LGGFGLETLGFQQPSNKVSIKFVIIVSRFLWHPKAMELKRFH